MPDIPDHLRLKPEEFLERLEKAESEGRSLRAVTAAEMMLDICKNKYEPGVWQPIETAPRDGTVILVWLPKPHIGSHIHAMRTGKVATIGSVFSWDAGSEPSHWQPLPPAPQE